MDKKEISRKAADAVIESPVVVKFGDEEITIKRPTLRTLISVSAEIGKMPELLIKEGKEIQSVIQYAQYCERIGNIFALLIHGARHKACFWHRIALWRTKNKILDKYTPKQLEDGLGRLFAEMELADFFALTTSLNAINLTKPTAEVGKN